MTTESKTKKITGSFYNFNTGSLETSDDFKVEFNNFHTIKQNFDLNSINLQRILKTKLSADLNRTSKVDLHYFCKPLLFSPIPIEFNGELYMVMNEVENFYCSSMGCRFFEDDDFKKNILDNSKVRVFSNIGFAKAINGGNLGPILNYGISGLKEDFFNMAKKYLKYNDDNAVFDFHLFKKGNETKYSEIKEYFDTFGYYEVTENFKKETKMCKRFFKYDEGTDLYMKSQYAFCAIFLMPLEEFKNLYLTKFSTCQKKVVQLVLMLNGYINNFFAPSKYGETERIKDDVSSTSINLLGDKGVIENDDTPLEMFYQSFGYKTIENPNGDIKNCILSGSMKELNFLKINFLYIKFALLNMIENIAEGDNSLYVKNFLKAAKTSKFIKSNTSKNNADVVFYSIGPKLKHEGGRGSDEIVQKTLESMLSKEQLAFVKMVKKNKKTKQDFNAYIGLCSLQCMVDNVKRYIVINPFDIPEKLVVKIGKTDQNVQLSNIIGYKQLKFQKDVDKHVINDDNKTLANNRVWTIPTCIVPEVHFSLGDGAFKVNLRSLIQNCRGIIVSYDSDYLPLGSEAVDEPEYDDDEESVSSLNTDVSTCTDYDSP